MIDDEAAWIETQQPDYRKPKMTELTDASPMPFGQWKGKPMQEIPARYLHYLHTTGIHDDRRPDRAAVSAYIKTNLSALRDEHKDGIW